MEEDNHRLAHYTAHSMPQRWYLSPSRYRLYARTHTRVHTHAHTHDTNSQTRSRGSSLPLLKPCHRNPEPYKQAAPSHSLSHELTRGSSWPLRPLSLFFTQAAPTHEHAKTDLWPLRLRRLHRAPPDSQGGRGLARGGRKEGAGRDIWGGCAAFDATSLGRSNFYSTTGSGLRGCMIDGVWNRDPGAYKQNPTRHAGHCYHDPKSRLAAAVHIQPDCH
jgi:hypothetical protein